MDPVFHKPSNVLINCRHGYFTPPHATSQSKAVHNWRIDGALSNKKYKRMDGAYGWTVCINSGVMLRDIRLEVRYGYVMRALIGAKEIGLGTMEDLVNYVSVSLIYGQRWNQDSIIAGVLACTKAGQFRFSESDGVIAMNSVPSKDIHLSRRVFITALGSLIFVNPCEAKSMKVVLNIVVFSYWSRPIFEVNIDGKGDEASGAYPNTGKGVTGGVPITLGPKKVTWRLGGPEGLPRNGETLVNKNILELIEILPGANYLGIHIYPDETVELSTSVRRPGPSAKGLSEVAKAVEIMADDAVTGAKVAPRDIAEEKRRPFQDCQASDVDAGVLSSQMR